MTVPRSKSIGRAMVLLGVMIIVSMLTLIGAGLVYRMQAENKAAVGSDAAQQAHLAAMSGLRRAVAVLRENLGNMDVWWHNPEAFQNQLVFSDGGVRWYFTVYADDGAGGVRYGVSDESARININTASEQTLLALPNMTEELVDCLLDYRDIDENTRPLGAEQEYYDRLATPYRIKNGPLTTLEELLQVKGFTPAVVFGEDANRNGVLDPAEDDGDEHFPPDNGDGQLDTGLYGVATTFGYDLDTDGAGRRRIDIGADPEELKRAELSDKTIEFITLYRAEGNTIKHPSELLNMRYQLTKPQGTRRAGEQIESGVGAAELALVLDRLTAAAGGTGLPRGRGTGGAGARLPVRLGLVNVNTAPAAVLAALPGMSMDLAGKIVDFRGQLDAEQKQTPAWLYAEGILSETQFKEVAPMLTTRSFQFRVRCVGFGVSRDGAAGRPRMLEAVVDMGGAAPRLVYLRDITRLGLPFAIKVGQDTD